MDSSAGKNLVSALAAVGVELLDEHKEFLEQIVQRYANADTVVVMNALADHLVLHGLAATIQQPIRDTVRASEPQVAAAIGKNVDDAIEALEGWLKKVAAEAPRT